MCVRLWLLFPEFDPWPIAARAVRGSPAQTPFRTPNRESFTQSRRCSAARELDDINPSRRDARDALAAWSRNRGDATQRQCELQRNERGTFDTSNCSVADIPATTSRGLAKGANGKKGVF